MGTMVTSGAPNPDVEILRAEMREVRGRLELLENRPITIERTVTISESTPAWIRALIVVASTILVPTLAWGGGQLYALNRSIGILEQRVGGLEQRVGGLGQRIGGLEQHLAAHEQSSRQELQQLRGEMIAGFAEIKAEIRARSK
jgi:hypothetical protein